MSSASNATPGRAREILSLLWAKNARDSENPLTYHPLLCHMLDTAAVAGVMWNRALAEGSRRRLAACFGLSAHGAGRWVPFLAGLHDLGKASPAFQLKAPDMRPRLRAAGLPVTPLVPEGRHGAITAWCLHSLLEAYGLPRGASLTLGTAIGGHHGIFPAAGEIVGPDGTDAVGGRAWDDARRRHAAELAAILELPSDSGPSRIDNPAAMVLAGLVSTADWIASDSLHFPYAASWPQPLPIETGAYWQEARKKAEAALGRLGWLDCPAPLDAAAPPPRAPQCPAGDQLAHRHVACRRWRPQGGLGENPGGGPRTVNRGREAFRNGRFG